MSGKCFRFQHKDTKTQSFWELLAGSQEDTKGAPQTLEEEMNAKTQRRKGKF